MNQDHEKVLEYRMLYQQLQQLQQNLTGLEQHLQELGKLQETLEHLSKVESDKDVLIPLGSGIFFKGKILDTSKLIMNVGANILVEKTVPEAVETVQKQANEVEQLLLQLEQEAGQIADQLEEVKKDIQE